MEKTKGKNGMSSLKLFQERTLYDETIKSIEVKSYPINLYGRVDEEFNVITPNINKIKGVDKSETSAMDFMSLAYSDFLKIIDKAKLRGFKIEGAYADLMPKQGFVDSEQLYHNYMQTVYQNFVTRFLKEDGRENKINNFYDFCEQFVQFVNRISEFPVTKAGFIESTYNSNMSSGLFLSIAQEDAGDDEIKFKYLNDKNFNFISDAAKFVGLAVDSIAPWRFIADINSPAMDAYFNILNLQKENIFETHFIKAENLYLFILYLRNFYETFVSIFPFISTERGIQYRSIETSIIDDAYFARMYIYFRTKEKSWEIDQSQFETLVRNIVSFSSYSGYNVAIINSLLTLRNKGVKVGLNKLIW